MKRQFVLISLLLVGSYTSQLKADPVPTHKFGHGDKNALEAVYSSFDRTLQSKKMEDIFEYYALDFLGKDINGKTVVTDHMKEFYARIFRTAPRIEKVTSELKNFSDDGDEFSYDVVRTFLGQTGREGEGKKLVVVVKAREKWAETFNIDGEGITFTLTSATETSRSAMLDGKPFQLK